MIIYILAFLLSIFLIWISKNKIKSKKVKILFMILAVLPLFLISAFRYDVGTDYIKRYTNDYLDMAKGKQIGNLEIGFKLIDYICLFFTKEPYLLFVITSLIILAIFYETIYKKSSNIILSVVIFFLGGYFFGSLNLIRQYIAISFLLIGYQFLIVEDKKTAYIGYTICAFLAFLMHSSSIVCFSILFLGKKVIANIKWVLPIMFIILILNENIMDILGILISKTRFNVYLSGNMAKGDVSILNILENLIVYLCMYGIYFVNKKQNKPIEKEGILFLNIQGIALLVTVAGVAHMLFSRIALYFCVFQILSIPYYLSIIPFNSITDVVNNKLKKQFQEKTIKIATYAIVLISFLGMFTYTNIINNDNGVLPYKTIFLR